MHSIPRKTPTASTRADTTPIHASLGFIKNNVQKLRSVGLMADLALPKSPLQYIAFSPPLLQ
ncbi:hypothetical protein IQ265_23950 [Nodosilinea sp. LEGE 06152]|uniref:hypothetical protein n=1 Tax=Nodosilinea sp. LEGE 06152 TaxID=2777966 RepID=UPI0018814932|nr:hypothetical protein [Nodosilinea sp. LEGE 06152]MBE9159863.1 hypothetical protein [Nodosilinea sp. LEGE 06152]